MEVFCPSDPDGNVREMGDWQPSEAAVAQLGERQTEDLKVPGSIPGGGNEFAWMAEWSKALDLSSSIQ